MEDTIHSQSDSETERSSIFRFEDLPGEIRNIIYGLFLVVDRPIEISRPVDKAASEKKAAEHRAFWGAGLPSGHRYVHKFSCIVREGSGKTTRKLQFRDISALSLVRTSKDISSEARPLLYACNTFRFESPKAFYGFYECAHTAISLLESIEFVGIPDSTVLRAPLAQSKKLSRICITIKSKKINKSPLDGLNFHEIISLVLGCRCPNCGPRHNHSNGEPLSPGEDCIASDAETQWRRLETVSVHISNFEIRFADDQHEAGPQTNIVKRRLKENLMRDASICIRVNVSSATCAQYRQRITPDSDDSESLDSSPCMEEDEDE